MTIPQRRKTGRFHKSMRWVVSMAAALALSAGGLPARAQQPPLIKLLVPAQPGGGLDGVSRALADGLRNKLGVMVVVENRPGAGGVIAAQAMKAAPADGSVYLMTTDHLLILPYTMKNIGFDPLTDFSPVAAINTFDVCFAVSTALVSATTMSGYIAQATKDEKLSTFGVSASGSMSEFFGYVISRKSGVNLTPTAYRGSAPLMIDLMGGHLPSAIVPCREALEGLKSHKVRLLATVQKLTWAADVPTFVEAGYDLQTVSWIGMYASAKVPADRRLAVDNAVRELMQDSLLKEKISSAGFEPRYLPGKELGAVAQKTTSFWSALIRESGFQAK